jgi:hypothetical protein
MVRERRAYIILVVVCVLLSLSTLMISVQAISQNNKKWCVVVNHFATAVIVKPAHPKINKELERDYERYVRYLHLAKAIGCVR